ncbi:SAM-dependent methyltransferase [Brevibacillus laterosporus]|uniref:class I SAM-dependent methyltransferase n=1 Tax=Brevibacillus laterosporus TaxID=1465 RepID=UPI000C78E93D|nr:class I SAM-dependent methyltransferase [Brevibacillus laterosporus]AUM64512.1 SAM-dependent methyltransferase [Brevibacillus laterosporus]
MNTDYYKYLYDKVGEEIGWDFSSLKISVEGKTWSFYDEVIKVSKKNDIVLDIGTGGGERVLKIAPHVMLLVGIDESNNMIKVAQANLNKSGLENVEFIQMNACNLKFPNRYFDIVSCRHSHFDAQKVANLLVDGGIFLTQQVSENDKLNIKEAFGKGQNFETKDGTLKEKYVKELQGSGFTKIEVFEYDAEEFYGTPDDLIFLLKHTPIVPRFGCEEHDFEILKQFIFNNSTDRGIKTNSKRFMIIAKL